MQISRNSWHYRLINFLDFDHPDNLCAYCWKTIWAIVFSAFALMAMVFVFGLPLWYWLGADIPLVVAIIVGGLELIGVLVCIYYAIEYAGWWAKLGRQLDRLLPEYTPKPPKPKKPPGLFRSWISAQHRKVCPLLDFE